MAVPDLGTAAMVRRGGPRNQAPRARPSAMNITRSSFSFLTALRRALKSTRSLATINASSSPRCLQLRGEGERRSVLQSMLRAMVQLAARARGDSGGDLPPAVGELRTLAEFPSPG